MNYEYIIYERRVYQIGIPLIILCKVSLKNIMDMIVLRHLVQLFSLRFILVYLCSNIM